MQAEDHAGYKTGDVWTRWLPEYDKRSYLSRVVLCQSAIRHWMKQQDKAQQGHARAKTKPTKDRWNTREGWCKANIRRWQNSLRDVMEAEGTLAGYGIPRA